jgi:GT2 family glycosyltransferase
MARVSVITVSYNSQPYLKACLASIVAQREVTTDIIVVDNASTDDSAALVTARFPTIRLITNRDNLGFATAANQGVALATGEYVLLLNPDATLLPGTLAQLLRFLETRPQVAAVGPRQWLDADRTWQWSIVPHPPHCIQLAWLAAIGTGPASTGGALGLEPRHLAR